MEPNLSLPSSRPAVEAETDRMWGIYGRALSLGSAIQSRPGCVPTPPISGGTSRHRRSHCAGIPRTQALPPYSMPDGRPHLPVRRSKTSATRLPAPASHHCAQNLRAFAMPAESRLSPPARLRLRRNQSQSAHPSTYAPRRCPIAVTSPRLLLTDGKYRRPEFVTLCASQ